MAFGKRSDGDLVKDVPLTRRIMPFIMRGRNESIAFFEQKVDVTKTNEFLQKFREKTGLHATMLHLIIWSAAQVLQERPKLNRFTKGGRIYQRRGTWISFSAKKAKSDDKPLFVVKRKIEPEWSLEEVVRNIEGEIKEGRSDKVSHADKELKLFLSLPVFLLNFLVKTLMKLDDWGMVPYFFIRDDPMYASAFIANLGSIGMDAPFHHLYEYGNIPVFIMVGKTQNEVVADEKGNIVVKPLMPIHYSYDERVEDGLYCARSLELFKVRLEDPSAYIKMG